MELRLSGTSIDEEGAGQQQQQPAVLLDLRTQDRWWMVAVFCRSSLSPETRVREESLALRAAAARMIVDNSSQDCQVCVGSSHPSAHGLQTKLYKVMESRHIRYTYLIFCILRALHHL